MTDPSLFPVSPLERPRCPRCQTRMMLARREYHEADRTENRLFECSKCDFVETKVVTDPLQSGALARLANGIRPPE